MKRTFPFSILMLTILLSTFSISCKESLPDALSLNEHSKVASLANDARISPENKFHALGEIYVALLKECQKIEENHLMRDHLATFVRENKFSLGKLGKEIDLWQKALPDEERIFFAMKLASKSYTKELTKLVPQIKKRLEGQPEFEKDFNLIMNTIKMYR